MRVGVDATCWSNPRGYGRYTRGLLNALLDRSAPHDYVLFVDAYTWQNTRWPIPETARCVVVQTSQAQGLAASANGRRPWADVWAMTRAVTREVLDVLFYPSVYSYFPALTGARVILGVHDVIPEDFPKIIFPDPFRRRLWRTKAWLAHRRADYIVTVSEHARAGIMRHFGHAPERVWVVGEAPDPVFRPIADREAVEQTLARHGLDPAARFVIHVGGLNPHKNLTVLLETLAHLREQPGFSDLRLVLVGPLEEDVFTPGARQIRQVVTRLKLDRVVHFTGYLPDEEVARLLNAAQALVMPSLEEGFGLPAVEAAACGTPVIATANSPLPQLLKGGGVFINPSQPGALQAALTQLLADDDYRQRLGSAALQSAQSLSWPRAAGEFQRLLTAVETRAG